MWAVALNDAEVDQAGLTVDTDTGRLVGTWRGAAAVRAGGVFDIELDVPRPWRWSEIVMDRDVVDAGQTDTGSVRCQVVTVDDMPTGDLEFFPTGI